MADDDSTTQARALYDQAHAAYTEGRYADAADLFAEVAAHPGSPATGVGALHFNLALCFAHEADWAKARQHLGASGYDEAELATTLAAEGVTWPAAEGSPAEAQQRYAFAVSALEAGNWELGVDTLAELTLHPGLPASGLRDVHWNMAIAYGHAADWERARAQLAASGYSEAELAARLAEKGISWPAAPGSDGEADQRFEFATAAMDAGEYETALSTFAELAFHGGTPAGGIGALHWNMAVACAHLGRMPKALEHVEASGETVEAFRATMDQRGVTVP